VPNTQLILGLLVAIAVLAGLARLIRVPAPVVLVLGGLAIGLVPGAPQLDVEPDLILFVFLPPLLYSAAFLCSASELRAHLRPILLLAVGLVVATAVVVAAVAHVVFGLGWASAFVLGAVLAATDPLSATSVLRRLGAPRRVETILEGESLVNDGTALVTYKLALAAAAAGSFTVPLAVVEFGAVSIGGAVVGLAIGWLSARIRRMFDDAPIEITVSLLTPYAAYIPAERLGVSGVLAAVTAGLYVGAQAPRIFSAETRLRYYAFWEVLTFLLNSLLFLLIGLEVRSVVDALEAIPFATLLGYGLLVSGIVLGLRMAWMFALAPADRLLPGEPVARSWQERVVLGWSGMRGAISLAAALAIPLEVDGSPFPGRDLVIFLTYATIFVTLVVPGLTLGSIVEVLLVSEHDASARSLAEARAYVARSALGRLDELVETGMPVTESVGAVRDLYAARLAEHESQLGADPRSPDRSDGYWHLRTELLGVERDAVDELRRGHRTPDAILRELDRDLDLEDARLHR
jgi:Na+/H+ antiporter